MLEAEWMYSTHGYIKCWKWPQPSVPSRVCSTASGYVWDLPWGGFTMKVMKLQLEGPSLARAPCKALGGALDKYSLSYQILYSWFHFFFFLRGSEHLYKLHAPQNLQPAPGIPDFQHRAIPFLHSCKGTFSLILYISSVPATYLQYLLLWIWSPLTDSDGVTKSWCSSSCIVFCPANPSRPCPNADPSIFLRHSQLIRHTFTRLRSRSFFDHGRFMRSCVRVCGYTHVSV